MLEHSVSAKVLSSGSNSSRKDGSTVGSPSKYITVVDVYDLAEAINHDFEDLAEQFGKDPIENIVRKVLFELYFLHRFILFKFL